MKRRPNNDWSDESALDMWRAFRDLKKICRVFDVCQEFVRGRLTQLRIDALEETIEVLYGRIRMLEARADGALLTSSLDCKGWVLPSVNDTIVILWRQGLGAREIGARLQRTDAEVVEVLARAKAHGLLGDRGKAA